MGSEKHQKALAVWLHGQKHTSIRKHLNDSSLTEHLHLQGEESPSKCLYGESTRIRDVCYDFPVNSSLVGGGKCAWACTAKSMFSW